METIQMRRQPCEHDGDDNQRNENPATGRIFAPADSESAASGKGVGDCTSQGQNDYALYAPDLKRKFSNRPSPKSSAREAAGYRRLQKRGF